MMGQVIQGLDGYQYDTAWRGLAGYRPPAYENELLPSAARLVINAEVSEIAVWQRCNCCWKG